MLTVHVTCVFYKDCYLWTRLFIHVISSFGLKFNKVTNIYAREMLGDTRKKARSNGLLHHTKGWSDWQTTLFLTVRSLLAFYLADCGPASRPASQPACVISAHRHISGHLAASLWGDEKLARWAIYLLPCQQCCVASVCFVYQLSQQPATKKPIHCGRQFVSVSNQY